MTVSRAERIRRTKLVAEKRLARKKKWRSYLYFKNWLEGKGYYSKYENRYYLKRKQALIKYYFQPGYYKKKTVQDYCSPSDREDWLVGKLKRKSRASYYDLYDSLDEIGIMYNFCKQYRER